MTDDLKFTGEIPAVINRNGSADDVFAPVRSSSCDINIVSKEILDDLYTANKDEMKVRIEKDLYEINEETIHHDAWTKRVLDRPSWKEKVFHPAWDGEGCIEKKWTYENIDQFKSPDKIWKKDNHIYYSDGNYQYELIDGKWGFKKWVFPQSSIGVLRVESGDNVWEDNNGHTYYSEYTRGYSTNTQLELIDGEWVIKTWTGINSIDGSSVWKDNNGHIFCSYYSSSMRYYYHHELVNGQWINKSWNKNDIAKDYIWRDNNGHIYSSNNGINYELVNGEWIDKTWNKTISRGDDVWHYNNHIYYSHNNEQYELVNGEWIDKTWNKLSYGNYIWEDNEGNIYCLIPNDHHYELVNDEWIDKTWYLTHNPDFIGKYIWRDNDGHIYHSLLTSQYELIDNIWVKKTWNKYIPYGDSIWRDNEGHIYYSYESSQYGLVNGQWVNKTWNKTIKYGNYIWNNNDGHTYYSKGVNEQYELVSGQWADKSWNKEIINAYIWEDNEGNIYYSNEEHQYQLRRGQWYDKYWNENIFANRIWKDKDNNIYYTYINSGTGTNIQYKLSSGLWIRKSFEWGMDDVGVSCIWRDNENNTYYSYEYDQLEVGVIHHPEWTETVIHPATYKTVTVWPAWDQVVKTKSKIGTEPVWEGYMTPNTYSQEVTQNLDEISMTAIDPVSLLKFIHIDKIMSKPNICTYGEIIGKALALVKLDSDILYVENSVTYESNTLLDMKVQVGNFWDEDGETSTVYDAIGEMLKIFGCCLVFQGDSYLIYDLTKNSDTSERTYSEYTIEDNGTLTFVSNSTIGITKLDVDDWTSNNTSIPTVEIRETYDKVTAVASTSIPEYSSNIMDIIDPMERDLYDIGHLNIELNSIKGYRDTQWPWTQFTLDTNPHWYYIWNGTYINSDYGLETNYMVDGWNNINAFYEYLNGERRDPDETGSILNFYGSADNPIATGREQEEEKTVEIKKRITSFAPDNGVPPELLERSDTRWYYENNYEEEDPRTGTHNQFSPSNLRPELYIYDDTNVKFGHSSDAVVSRPVYIQEYENMVFNSLNSQTIEISLMQGYSRTGQNDPIPMITGSTVEDVLFRKEDGYIDIDSFSSGNNNKVYCWPRTWRDDEVLVNRMYFNRSEWITSSATLLKPIWDRRRVDVTMEVNNTTYQFDGKRWYQLGDNESPSVQHAFFLKKLMNGEKIFIDDFKYNIIETSDGSEYSLEDEAFIYYTDTYGSVCDADDSGARSNIIDVYVKDGYSWSSRVKCDEGYLSIMTHNVDGINGKVKVVIYSSSLLGISGMETHSDYSYENRDAIYYNINGTLREVTSDQILPDRPLTQEDFPYTFNTPTEKILSYKFMPICVSYIKAEHLDLDIAISVPKSNLGQMFEESDIKYVINLNRNYQEQYEGPNFKVNTKHGFVANSYSYLIGQNEVANPDLFVINGVNVRPECYVTQAYLNYLSNIRKIYSKTMVSDEDIDNVQTYIRTPEINGGKWMRVLSDSYDLKTGRHSIVAVESNDMEVSALSNFSSMEIPRRARSERYNYISSNKKK